MTIQRYNILAAVDYGPFDDGLMIIPRPNGEYYKADDVVSIIREACGDETKDDIVGILAEAFGIDIAELEES